MILNKRRSLFTGFIGRRHFMLLLPAAFLLIPEFMARPQETGAPVSARYRGVSTAVRFDVSLPLRLLARLGPSQPADGESERRTDLPTGREGPLGPQGIDPIVQRVSGPAGNIAAPLQSFDGLNQTSGPVPPDPVGDVGPNHYVQMVNVRYAVYSKTGTLLAGPANINTLFAGFGGPCQAQNSGDPIVVYDQFADRWLLSQFTSSGPTYFNCVALSTGPDPTGTYFRWAFSTGSNFPDYPKYSVWSNAYYISTREFAGGGPFAGIGAYAVNRAQMLAGNPAPQVISFLAPTSPMYAGGDGLLPADIDGSTLPPSGSPAFFIGSQDNGGPYGAPFDALNIWKFTANFTTPASSSFVLANTVPVTEFDSMLSTCSGRACVPQPGTTQRVDHQGYRQRPIYRAAYRNFGTHESIVTNQSVEVPTGMSGIRWWEIRSPNSSPTIFQEGTYAPGMTDGIHRWFGSVAQDEAGNMALGYSASNGTSTFPSVRYTGRLVSDPPGTMPQGEGTFVAGGGSQLSTSARWGDYSSMNVDSTDDCTFWYTTQYYATTSTSGWRTRIGSFQFPGCGGGGPMPTLASITPASGMQGKSLYVRMEGANLTVGSSTVNVAGGGVSVPVVNVDGQNTSAKLTAKFVIDPGAAAGPRDVTVTTPAGISNAVTFTIQAPDAPCMVSLPTTAAGGLGQLNIAAGLGAGRQISGTWAVGWMVLRAKSVSFAGTSLFSGSLPPTNPPMTRALSVNAPAASAVAVLNAFYSPHLCNYTVTWASTISARTPSEVPSRSQMDSIVNSIDLSDFDGQWKEIPR
jgi:hypothetical protein